MRIAFLGKGGSGKTTATAGFIRYAAKKHPFVLAVDADINAHLYQALNINVDKKVNELSACSDDVFNYLRGERTDLGERPMIATTPPTMKSNFVMVSPNDPFIKKYGIPDSNISLLTVGSYKADGVGASCFHEMLFTLAGVLHHTLDTENEVIVADTTAGTDNVATSLVFAYDMNVFVVEPTQKSVKVFKNFTSLHPQLEESTFVIANKIDGPEDEAFIRKVIPAEKLLGLIPHSDNLRRFEQGDASALEEFQAEQTVAFDAVYALLTKRKRNWSKYLEQLREANRRLCQRWYNPYLNMELDIDLDTDFDYERGIAQETSNREKANTLEQKELAFAKH